MPAAQAKRLPHYPVPVALIGRLAVDRRYAGQGLGSMLLADAIDRVAFASQTLAVYAVVVDAKNDQARRFYERFGFVMLPESGAVCSWRCRASVRGNSLTNTSRDRSS